MSTFVCESCSFKTALKNNYTRHMESKRHLAKCACGITPVVPVAAVNTIDNYFKKIVTNVEAVTARLDVVVATVESFSGVLAQVIESTEKNTKMLLENESLKSTNAALRVELAHVREMVAIQIENAALKARLEAPEIKYQKAEKPEKAEEPKPKKARLTDEEVRSTQSAFA